MIWRTILLFGLILTLITTMMTMLRRQPSEAYWIAYISGRDDPQLEVMYSDGSQRDILLDLDHTIGLVRWSPDNRSIVVSAVSNTESMIYLISPRGSNIRTIIRNTNRFGGNLIWSPDARLIAFTGDFNGQRDIYKMTLDAAEMRQVTNTYASEHDLSWSPNGQWIYYRVDNENEKSLSRVSVDGSIVERLTPYKLNPGFAVWSPDGEWIAFDAFVANGMRYLFRMRPDGTDLRQLGREPTFGYPKEWSPRNDWFVFDGDNSDVPVFYLLSTNGNDLHTIPAHGQYNNLPQWSPDGEWILFEAWDNNQNDIYRMRPDGSDLQNLTSSPTDEQNAAISPLIDMSFASTRLLAIAAGLVVIGIIGAWVSRKLLPEIMRKVTDESGRYTTNYPRNRL